jgi:putative redox protein
MKASAHLLPGTLQSDVLIRDRFHLLTDEPTGVGGDDEAPAPHELLPASLAACISTTIAMYARTKEWDLGDVRVDVDYDQKATPRHFTVDIHLGGHLSADQLARLEKVAATCPVRRSLEAGVTIEERVHAAALA